MSAQIIRKVIEVAGDDIAEAFGGMVAGADSSNSIKNQLIGIEQIINKELFDAGPFTARKILNNCHPASVERHCDCSIYDSTPSDRDMQRVGALVFMKFFKDAHGVERTPTVQLVGFGANEKSAWKNAHKQNLSQDGVPWHVQKSYMLWYQFKLGKIEYSKIPYPFYLAVTK